MYIQKKGVVLLITLFFITAISILILKNLDDSNQFIKEVSHDTALTQINITNKNVQDEVIKLVNKYKDNIDELLEIASAGIPFDYGNINLIIKLENYIEKDCNLNDIKNLKDLDNKCESISTDYISYPYDFIEVLNRYKPKEGLKNQKQIEFVIDKYILSSRDDKIHMAKDNFGFLTIAQNQDNESISRYLKCSYDININNIKATSSFIFKLGLRKIEKGSHSLVLTN